MWNRGTKKIVYLMAASIILLSGLSGCKSKKSAVTDTKIGSQVEATMQNQDYKRLKMRVKVEVPNLLPMKMSGTIMVETGKRLMVSVQPLLGIEMYRLVCTADSVIFLDRLQHTCVAEPYSSFTNKSYNLNYGMIEGLICNRLFDPLDEGFKDVEVTTAADATIYRKKAENYYAEFTQKDGKLWFTTISTHDGTHYVSGTYNNFTEKDGYTFPQEAVCNVKSAKYSLSMNISYDNITFNGDVSISSALPSGYKKQTIESLTQSLFK